MNFDVLQDGLSKVIQSEGMETIKNGRKVVAILSDYIPNAKVERNALKSVYESGAMKYLLLASEQKANLDHAYAQAVGALKSYSLMDETIAEQLIAAICNTMNLSITDPSCNPVMGATDNLDLVEQQRRVQPAMPTLPPLPEPMKPIRLTLGEEEFIKRYLKDNLEDDSAKQALRNSAAIKRKQNAKKATVAIGIILGALAVLAAVVGLIIWLSAFDWTAWQWIIGVAVAIVIVVIAIMAPDFVGEEWLRQAIPLAFSLINTILWCIFNEQYSQMAVPIFVGVAIAMFIACCYAHDDGDEEFGMLFVPGVACNIAMTMGAYCGISGWNGIVCFMIFLIPMLLVSLVVVGIYNKCGGTNGIVIASIVSVIAISACITVGLAAPHYVHTLRQWPTLIDEDQNGPEKAVCACGEIFEITEAKADMIHSGCEQWNKMYWTMSWDEKQQYARTFLSDGVAHWQACPCGTILGYRFHSYNEEGKCDLCSYNKTETETNAERKEKYKQAVSLMETGEYGAAAIAFYRCGDYLDARELCDSCWGKLSNHLHKTILTLFPASVVWISPDGTVHSTDESDDAIVSEWTNMVSISGAFNAVAGLKNDGTAVAYVYNDNGECDITTWKDIVSVSAGEEYIVGLKKDGTVVACGNNDYGQCNVEGWTDIISVQAAEGFTIGVKSDGTAVLAGNPTEEINLSIDVSHWQNTRYMCSYPLFSVTNGGALQLAISDKIACDLAWWKRLQTLQNVVESSVAVSSWVFTLHANGTLSCYDVENGVAIADGTYAFETWKDIRYISYSGAILIGIDSKGRVFLDTSIPYGHYGQHLNFDDIYVMVP